MTRVVLLILDGNVSRQSQLVKLHAYAVEHALTLTAVVVGDPRSAAAAVEAGTAEAILALRPDSYGVLVSCGLPVVLVHPPANRRHDGARPLNARVVCGVPGRLLVGALERLAGDVATVALVFGLPVEVVAEVDAERRARGAEAA